ncbi:MAG: LTA synthase family protein [Bacteroidales bacterium]
MPTEISNIEPHQVRKRYVPVFLQYLLIIFILCLLFFAVLRITQTLIHRDQLNDSNTYLLWYCYFNRGLLFDVVTTTYITILPAVILLIAYLSGRIRKSIVYITATLLSVFFILTLAVSLSDIPFFSYYNARINSMILAWTDDLPLMIKAVFGNIYYIPLILVFLGLVFFLVKLTFRFTVKKLLTTSSQKPSPWYVRVIWSVFVLFALFLGLRGDVDPAGMPIQVKHVFETQSPFINQLAINPVFNFLRTFSDFKIDYLPDDQVIKITQDYLGVEQKYESPVARDVTFTEDPRRMNIVIVIMESMYVGKMKRFGNDKNLSPVLDSLADNGLTFNNVYTAGIHTYNGVFSTLFSLPALMQNKPTLSSVSSGQSYAGLPNVLKKEGYKTVFFVTGSKDFDNFSGVFPYNGIDRIVDEEYYPPGTRLNNWGVGDHVMFDYSVPVIDSLAVGGNPFLAVYMTVSTHTPYTVPEDIPYKPNAESVIDKSYQYADWSIGRFLNQVKNKPWFHNTIFVFIADHGQVFDPVYDMPLSYHHTPLIYYTPSGVLKPETQLKQALQIDVFPTLMGILKIPYVNNTLGIDLRKESRPFAYFSADYRLGVLNEEYFLLIDKSGKEALYKYRENSLIDYFNNKPALVDSMKRYTYSMLQTTQYMLRKRLTGLPGKN